MALRAIVVLPVSPSVLATITTNAISSDLSRMGMLVDDVLESDWHGIPRQSDSLLSRFGPILVGYQPLVNQIVAADTSLLSVTNKAAFVDVTNYPDTGYHLLLQNATNPCRRDYAMPFPATNPTQLVFEIERCSYDIFSRDYYVQISKANGALFGTTAAASATSAQATVFVGRSYSVRNPMDVNGPTVQGIVAVSFSTTTLSQQLATITKGLSGAAVLVYEVLTSQVVGVSWSGDDLLDRSRYNISDKNPIMVVRNLSSLASNYAMRQAIDALGGAPILCQPTLPFSVRDNTLNGYFVSVRNVNTPMVANMALRAIVVLPVSPSVLATITTNAISSDLSRMGMLVDDVLESDWHGIPRQSDSLLSRFGPILVGYQPLVNQIVAADTSLLSVTNKAAFVDVTNYPDTGYHLLLQNATNPCRRDYAMPFPATNPTQLVFEIERCSYDIFSRDYYVQISKANGALFGTTAAASATSAQATVFVGRSYSVRNPMDVNGPTVQGIVAVSFSTTTLSQQLATITKGLSGAAVLVYEVLTSQVVGVSWSGDDLLDRSRYNISDKNPIMVVRNLSSLASNYAMRQAIDALGGAPILCQPTLPFSVRDNTLNGYFVSVRNVNTPMVANMALRAIVVLPVSPSVLATITTNAISSDLSRMGMLVDDVLESDWHGIPRQSDSLLSRFGPILVGYQPLVNQIVAADTSLLSVTNKAAFVDVTNYPDTGYHLLLQNATNPCRRDYAMPFPATNPTQLVFEIERCSYDIFSRDYYVQISKANGALFGTTAAASATSAQATVFVGRSYSVRNPMDVNGPTVQGIVAVSFSTTTLSQQLATITKGLSGAAVLVYEVLTSQVVGVSWSGDDLLDRSRYNISDKNPIMVVRNLSSLASNYAMRQAIDALGGAPILCQPTLPFSVRDNTLNGYFVSVRNVNTPMVANMALRAIVVLPVSPSVLATITTNAISSDLSRMGMLVDDVLESDWHGIPRQSDSLLSRFGPILVGYQPLVNQIVAADTSLLSVTNKAAFVDVTNYPDTGYHLLLQNATNPCRRDYAMPFPATNPTQLVFEIERCSYDIFSRDYYVQISKANGALFGTTAAASATSAQATVFVGRSYSVRNPMDVNGPTVQGIVAVSFSTTTLSQQLATITKGLSGAAVLVYEVLTSQVVGVSWSGDDLLDRSRYNISDKNPIMVVRNLSSLASNYAMRQAIDALGGAPILCQPTLPFSVRDNTLNGYFVSVRNVNTPMVANMALRAIVVLPVSPSVLATITTNAISSDLSRMGMLVDDVLESDWHGIPRQSDSLLSRFGPILVGYQPLVNQIVAADTSLLSVTNKAAFVDVTNYPDTGYHLLLQNATNPCRRDYAMPFPATNPTQLVFEIERCSYDIFSRDYYVQISKANGALFGTTAAASATSAQATVFVGRSYSVRNPMDVNGPTVQGIVAVSFSTTTLSQQLATITKGLSGAAVLVYEVLTSQVVGVSWSGDDLLDRSRYNISDKNPIMVVRNLSSLASNYAMRQAIDALGGAPILCQPTLPFSVRDNTLNGYFVSVRNVNTPMVANMALRAIVVLPVSPSVLATITTNAISSDLSRMGMLVDDVLESDWHGIPRQSDSLLSRFGPILVGYQPLVNQIVAADTSLLSVTNKAAFVDVTNYPDTGYHLLLQNATNPCRRDYAMPFPATNPTQLVFEIERCSYDIFSRDYYVQISKANGALFGTTAAASATSAQATVFVGRSYSVRNPMDVNGPTVQGIVAVSFSTTTLSQQLATITKGLSGAAVLVYEVLTSQVVGVSWSGDDLLDRSRYNISDKNPIMVVRNLSSLASNYAMRQAIDALGGAPILCQPTLPFSVRDNTLNGYFVSVRNVNTPMVANMALRAIVVLPVSPSVLATITTNAISSDLSRMGMLVDDVLESDWHGIPRQSDSLLSRFGPILVGYQPLVNQIVAADTSLLSVTNKAAFVDVTNYPDTGYHLLLQNATNPCRRDYAMPFPATNPTQLVFEIERCSYDIFSRDYYVQISKANGALFGTTAAASATSAQATVFVGRSYSVRNPMDVNGPTVQGIVAVSFSTTTLSQQLATITKGLSGAAVLVYEVLTSQVVGVSWSGDDLLDRSRYNISDKNPIMVVRNLSSLASNYAMRQAIDALGGAPILCQPTLPFSVRDNTLNGYFVSVRNVNTPMVANMALRAIVVLPVSPSVLATITTNAISSDLSRMGMLVDDVLESDWHGIPRQSDSLLSRFGPILVGYQPLVNQIVAADTSLLSVTNKAAFVDVTNYPDTGYHLLLQNATNPCRRDYAMPFPATNPTQLVFEIERCSYDIFSRDYYVQISKANGALFGTTAAASATSAQATVFVGRSYSVRNPMDVNGPTVQGIVAVSFSTTTLSQQLATITKGLSGAAVLVYEVLTSQVVGVSWSGDDLLDRSRYNISDKNPIMVVRNLSSLASNYAMRQAIDALGGAPILCQPTLPFSVRDNTLNGYFVSVRNVNTPMVANMALRAIVVLPVSPSVLATITTNAISSDLSRMGMLVDDVLESDWHGIPRQSDSLLSRFGPILVGYQPLVNQIVAADTSLLSVTNKAAFVDVTNYPDTGYHLLLQNATNPCRRDYAMPFPATNPTQLVFEIERCSYDIFSRDYYVQISKANGALFGTTAAASATSAQATVFVGRSYSVRNPMDVNGPTVQGIVAVSFSTTTLSQQLATITKGLSGAAVLVYEVLTSQVVGVSWSGDDLLDRSRYNVSDKNPIMVVRNLSSLASNYAMRQAIDALGGAPILCQPTLPFSVRDNTLNGYFVSVRNVNTPGVANMALRAIVVLPVSPSVLATITTNAISSDLSRMGMLVDDVLESDWHGIPRQSDSLLSRFGPILVGYQPLVNQIVAADTSLLSVTNKAAFVDVTNYPDTGYHLLLQNATNPCRRDYAMPFPATNPTQLVFEIERCSYDIFSRDYYVQISKANGALFGTTAAASATSAQATVFVGRSYSVRNPMDVNGPTVQGIVAVSFSTTTLSQQLATITKGLSGAAVLVYEVLTSQVVGVSWSGRRPSRPLSIQHQRQEPDHGCEKPVVAGKQLCDAPGHRCPWGCSDPLPADAAILCARQHAEWVLRERPQRQHAYGREHGPSSDRRATCLTFCARHNHDERDLE